VANCPETYKPVLAEGSGRNQLVRLILIVSETASVELKTDPAVVLATRQYVDDAIIVATQQAAQRLAEHEQSRNHPDATLSAKGFTQLSSATDSTAENVAATPRAVKAVR
ncbi:phage tail protein, partial [Klebsiella pneumoniae]|uniref:phage tail protein n=1 Tax=Klebsiella pneumoniae TaxID=573 RepID=UPI001F4186E2